MKRAIIILLIMLILANHGCQKTGVNTGPQVIEYHKGTQGIEINTVKNLPPDEVIEGNDFVIGLELKNKGASDIEGGIISISGFERGYVAVDQPEFTFDIEGKKPGFPEGGFDIINFKAKNIAMPEILETYSAPYRISALYHYETNAGTEICINPDIYGYSPGGSIACVPKEIRLSGGQGAPVAVTKVEEALSPFGEKIKVNIIIYFANKGKGKVVEGVIIEDVRLSDEPIICKNQGPIILKDKEEKAIVCSTETMLSEGAYLAPLSIKLSYDYALKIDEKLKIRSLQFRKTS